MKLVLIETGKTRQKEIALLAEDYHKRLKRYLPFEKITIPDLKNTRKMREEEVCRQEGDQIRKQLQPGDHVVLLDENGKQRTSVKFANHLQQLMNRGIKRLVFVIGGPYGFDSAMYDLANEKLSLSPMTFSHQIIRPVFAEQLYRALSILNNEPYHHQ